MRKIQRALLSVSDKTGIVDFAQALVNHGVEILSTGGTAKRLHASGVPVTEVSDYTGFPEMMDSRVKTLHPKIHGGLLGRRGMDDGVMEKHGILPIDMVVVNLYPFRQTVAHPDCDLATAMENVDIGGPTILAPPLRITLGSPWWSKPPTTRASWKKCRGTTARCPMPPGTVWR